MRVIIIGLSLVLAGCGDDAGDAGDTRVTDTQIGTDTSVDTTDTIATEDTATEDTAATDTASDDIGAVDGTTAADMDADEVGITLPLPGFGAISGDCGVLDDELTADGPSYFVTRFDFGTDPYDAADLDLLTDGAKEILADGNAGGSSIRSEMFTFELLARCELATLVKTENEVVYDDLQSKKTDMILRIDDLLIGVNPTRAIGYPFDAPYTEAQAKTILEKKLGDINESTTYVSAADRWEKQILVVFAYADGHAASVQAAWGALPAELKRDTIALVVITDGADTFIYSDQE
ncbi:MAG: hypothetical protein IT385_12745 [Deltaproteobacteria bacterium]|nr:hypothetical protein [Deltaproteobacteria bacterium]